MSAEEEAERKVVENVAVTVRSTVLSATTTTATRTARSNVNGGATKRKNGIIAKRNLEKQMMEKMIEQMKEHNEKLVSENHRLEFDCRALETRLHPVFIHQNCSLCIF